MGPFDMSRRSSIFLYCLLAYGLSWSQWLWLLWQGERVGPGSSASHLPGLMGPMLAALVVTGLGSGRDGLADLGRRMVAWPRQPFAFLAALAVPPALALAALAFGTMRGDPLPPASAFAAYPGLPAGVGLAGLLAVMVLNGYGEEVGWRGWLFETLEPRQGRFRAALIVAVVWLVWHLPLFWLNLSMAALVGPMLAGWAIGLVLGSFVLSQLYLMTGRSLAAVVLWHVVFNYCVATSATSGMVAAAVSSAVMAWGAVVALRWARTG